MKTTDQPKIKLFFNALQAYDAIKDDCQCNRNIGALERRSAGVLNFKQKLIALIGNAGGNVMDDHRFQPANDGQLHLGGGTGYLGWVDFGTRERAIAYLQQYFELGECVAAVQHDNVLISPSRKDTESDSTPSKKEMLLEMGFVDAGRWIAAGTGIIDKGEEDDFWNSIIRKSNALYAFCQQDEIFYIGKTARSVAKRFAGYRTPGNTCGPNRRCHDKIKSILESQGEVRILVFTDNTKLQWHHYQINLAAGLEDALVAYFKPVLNGGGEGQKLETSTQNDEACAEEEGGAAP